MSAADAEAPVLVTGATGNVGRHLIQMLESAGAPVRAASRRGSGGVHFDFRDATTWPDAFDGVRSMFLVRPPDIARVAKELMPAVAYGQQNGLRRVVLLSVQGAGRVPVLPHAAAERWLRSSGLQWTFVRPSYFDQNLSTVFAADIRDRGEIVVPAGGGRTAFVDALDVAAVVAAALLDPAAHAGRVWTPTGPALTYDQVAEILSAELGRPVRYRRPGVVAFWRHARSVLEMAAPVAAVTTVLHTTARIGLAGFETTDVATVLGRPPTSFAEFAHRERAVWLPPVRPGD
jgi:uncharacterized protein YbjT (DUF2867 family)